MKITHTKKTNKNKITKYKFCVNNNPCIYFTKKRRTNLLKNIYELA